MTAARRDHPPNPLDVGRPERQIVEIVYGSARLRIRSASRHSESSDVFDRKGESGQTARQGAPDSEVDGPRYLYRRLYPLSAHARPR